MFLEGFTEAKDFDFRDFSVIYHLFPFRILSKTHECAGQALFAQSLSLADSVPEIFELFGCVFFPFSISFLKIYFRLFECSKTSSEGCIPSVPHLWHKELICSSDLLLW